MRVATELFLIERHASWLKRGPEGSLPLVVRVSTRSALVVFRDDKARHFDTVIHAMQSLRLGRGTWELEVGRVLTRVGL